MKGICSAWDCVAQMIGFAILGMVAGVGGAYLLKRHRERAEALPASVPATAGLGRWPRRRALGRGRRRRGK